MLRYLEASHVKIGCILADLNNQPKPQSQLTTRIERTKDKQVSNVARSESPQPKSQRTYLPLRTIFVLQLHLNGLI